jgi:anti-sigma-K factor RskA
VSQLPDPIDARLEQRSKSLLDQSAEDLDARTRSRLTQARHAALEELRRSRRSPVWRWAPVAAMAAVAAVMIAMPVRDGSRQESPTLLLEDFDLVADSENLELLQDVEFYAWLDESDGGDSG